MWNWKEGHTVRRSGTLLRQWYPALNSALSAVGFRVGDIDLNYLANRFDLDDMANANHACKNNRRTDWFLVFCEELNTGKHDEFILNAIEKSKVNV